MAKASKTRRAKVAPRSRSRADSQRSAWSLRNDVVERALETGEFAGELEQLFGPEEYAELRQLAAEARRRSKRGGPAVLILPGIMGSKLGESTKFLGLQRDNVYWLDPVDTLIGRIERITFGSGNARKIKALGVFLIAYLRLKLRLQAQGFDAQFYPYDWRHSIRDLGAQLAQHLKGRSDKVSIVAHSMGGLVARAAVQHGAAVQRLIQLGSPNYGSYAPLMALRGVDSTVKKLAALDLAHDRAGLITRVLRGFPGLLELLPSFPGDPGLAYFDRTQWPTDAGKPPHHRMLVPEAALLRNAAQIQSHLQPVAGDAPWVLIAGVNQQTVTGATFNSATDELTYERTPDGDGTVPLRFALVQGLKTYYVEESHGQLANNRAVGNAVADLLDHGTTDALPDVRPAVRRARKETLSETELRALDPFADVVPAAPDVLVPVRGRTPAPRGVRRHLRAADLRNVLSTFVAPGATEQPAMPSPIAAARDELSALPAPWNRMIVGRARQHRIDIQIANCSITQVSARAYVLGLFREVTPTGAAAYVDGRLDGAVTEFTRRRMFSGGVGEVFILPASRSRLPADLVLFAGLGYFDQFNDEVQQTTAEHVIRTFVRTRVEHFATVLFGGGSGLKVADLLANLLKGFIRGKLDADVDHHFRCVTLCELDRTRYDEIRAELFRLSGTPLFENVEVTFTELPTPPPEPVAVEAPSARSARVEGPDPVYLIVRRERDLGDSLEFGASVLTAGAKAAILTSSQIVKTSLLNGKLAATAGNSFDDKAGRELGAFLATHVLAEPIRQVLAKHKDRHVVVVHDAPSSRLPWETLRLGDWEPALSAAKTGGGMSRRYMSENLSVAKYLEERPQGAKVKVLLVVNPTADLPGAQKEGDTVHKLFASRTDSDVVRLERAQATRKALLAELASGRYDLVHYAGHAFFDPELPARSGLLCHGDEPLTGVDLAAIGNLPKLVFFNACESGRVRRRRPNEPKGTGKKKDRPSKQELRRERVAPAEAYLRGGVANFIGTYWPVGDSAAELFSRRFYEELLKGETLGDAVVRARGDVHKIQSVDWSDYIHYGDYRFRLR